MFLLKTKNKVREYPYIGKKSSKFRGVSVEKNSNLKSPKFRGVSVANGTDNEELHHVVSYFLS